MARVSKYQKLVGQMVHGVYVQDYERQTRVSKTSGKKYYAYRLWVTQDGENVLEISTTSWSKWSFIRRLDKITDFKKGVKFHRLWDEQHKEEEEVVETTSNDWLEQYEYESLIRNAYFFKSSLRELLDKEMITDFRNININGGIIYETPESKIAFFDKWLERLSNEEDIFDTERIMKIVYSNEWRTELREVALKYFTDNWEEIWNNTRKQWQEWHGYSDEEYYNDNRNTTADWSESNEYDELFKDATTVKEVKRIYRKYSKQLHPDMGGNDEEFKALNKAYDRAMAIAVDDRKVSTADSNDEYTMSDIEALLAVFEDMPEWFKTTVYQSWSIENIRAIEHTA